MPLFHTNALTAVVLIFYSYVIFVPFTLGHHKKDNVLILFSYVIFVPFTLGPVSGTHVCIVNDKENSRREVRTDPSSDKVHKNFVVALKQSVLVMTSERATF